MAWHLILLRGVEGMHRDMKGKGCRPAFFHIARQHLLPSAVSWIPGVPSVNLGFGFSVKPLSQQTPVHSVMT